MPIYEYACERCGEEFEAMQRMSDPPLQSHDDCGGAVKRLISRTAFTLKGDGWYSDHYGLKQKKAEGGEKSGADKSGAEKTAGSEPKAGAAPKEKAKSDSKPSAPAASKGSD